MNYYYPVPFYAHPVMPPSSNPSSLPGLAASRQEDGEATRQKVKDRLQELASLKRAAPTSSSKGEKKRFEVKKWNAVALWAWDIVVDNCAICRNIIMYLCIECQANQASATSRINACSL